MARNDQAIAGQDLVVGRQVVAHGDLIDVDGRASSGPPFEGLAIQDNGLVVGLRSQASGKIDDIQHGLFAGDRQLARDGNLALNVIVLAVVSRDVDENRSGIFGVDQLRLAWSRDRAPACQFRRWSTSPSASSLRNFCK